MWSHVKALAGRSLATLDRRKPFTVKTVSESAVTILVGSTGRERRIARAEIEPAWVELQQHGTLTRGDVRERFAQYNPAYVAAILGQMPGVVVDTKPIRLRVR